MKKTVWVITAFISMIIISFAFTQAEAPPRYKNLKILPKNTTKEQMDSVMHHFTGSLGVKCNFCHVYNAEQKSMDFASDAIEEKDVARSMMRMTARLNRKYFDINNSKDLNARLEVTCFTCHHGAAHPETKAPKPQRSASGAGPRQGPPPAGGQAPPMNADSTKHQ